MPTPSPQSTMAGGGYYNQHSKVQALASEVAFPYLQAAAAEVPIPANGGEFRIADLGSAQGLNS